jgi:phage terminase large subunit-like protein
MKDYCALARGYEADVLSGRIPACKWVRLALERNVRDLARAAAGEAAFPFDFRPDLASRICLAAERLPHIKGPKARVIGKDDQGRPVWASLELEPSQCWFLSTLFGWVRRGTTLRRFRVALMLVPRKNAKSTLAAVVVLFMLTADGESGAEIYSAATTRDQAKTIAEIAWEMARRCPGFREYFGVKLGARTTRMLEVTSTASKFLPLSADEHTLDSLNVHLAAIDELHAHKTRGVWDVLDTATGARLQSLLLATTTAGVDLGGICYEQRGYLHKILEGVFADESYFGIEYTIDDEDDWTSEIAWRKANPLYGVSVQPDDFARKARQAARTPSSEANFKTKHLNVWVRASAPWFPMREWLALPRMTLDQLLTAPCWIGVDLAEVRDLASMVAVFRPEPGIYAFIGRHYLNEATAEASPIAALPGWVRQGHLIETPGNVTDYLRIEDDLIAWCELLNVQKICFDRALAARMTQNLAVRLESKIGSAADQTFIVTIPQNKEVMTPTMRFAEEIVLNGHARHDGDPVLSWAWSNVVVPKTGKEILPQKAGGKDSPNKIDPAVAALTALSQAMAPPDQIAEATVDVW